MEEPPKKYFRMFPGNEVRLMSAYFVKCTGCVKDENGKSWKYIVPMIRRAAEATAPMDVK